MFILTDPAGALALRQATQHVGRFDVYDLASAVLALCSGLALLVRTVRRPAGERHLRQRPVDELLTYLAVLGVGVLVLHQVVTDGLCHGACTFSLRGAR